MSASGPKQFSRGAFRSDELVQLRTALQHLQARFILSLNDVPKVRALFARATIETELSYLAGGAGKTKRGAR